MTKSRMASPTCGAASPMPGSSYMASHMSRASSRNSSVISSTGSETQLETRVGEFEDFAQRHRKKPRPARARETK